MVSRSLIVGLLVVLGGCDRQTQSPAQPEARASVTRDEVAADEVTAPSRPIEKIDRSHRGEAAPAVAFQDPAGKPVTLAAFRGRPVLVNLWATWCAPCVAELPTLDRLAKSGKVRVIAVSEDDDAGKAAPFLKGRGVSLAPYRDPQLGLSLAYRANLPTTVLYGADGRERWRVAGGFDWAGAEAAKLIDAG